MILLRNMLQMILLMVVVFNVVWAPYTWLSLVAIISPGTIPKWAFTWPTMFGVFADKLFSMHDISLVHKTE